MATHSKDDDLLPYALAGLVQRRDEIIAKIAEIRAQLAGEVIAAPGATVPAKKKRGRRKRVLSAEARERIAAAQRARWAASRKGTPAKAAPAAKKSATKNATKKRTLSPEARARIAEAQRKRWAATRKS